VHVANPDGCGKMTCRALGVSEQKGRIRLAGD
jgi:ABC-type cobalamin transport system ATPase subunit